MYRNSILLIHIDDVRLTALELGAAYHIQVWHIDIEHYLIFTDKSLTYISSYKGQNTKRNREGAGSAAQSTTMLDAYNQNKQFSIIKWLMENTNHLL